MTKATTQITARYWERFLQTYEGTEQLEVKQRRGRPTIHARTVKQ